MDASQLTQFTINFANITQAQAVTSGCAAITFYNTGTSILMVNNLPIQPNAQFVVESNEMELDVTQYFVNFNGPGINSCFVIRKQYRGLE